MRSITKNIFKFSAHKGNGFNFQIEYDLLRNSYRTIRYSTNGHLNTDYETTRWFSSFDELDKDLLIILKWHREGQTLPENWKDYVEVLEYIHIQGYEYTRSFSKKINDDI